MSKLRPECSIVHLGEAMPDETVLFLVKQALSKCTGLIHGRLHDGKGGHCAMGRFWQVHPTAAVHESLIDEIAAVNDSLGPDALPKDRWKTVNSWLRLKLATISRKQASNRS